MRLIDADNVRGLFDAEFKETRKLILAGETHLDNLAEGFVEADRVIWEMPTVDAEVVVRCKDCKHYLIADEFEGGKRYMCEVNHFSYINSDGDMRYCSYGARKDDEHEH